MGKVLEKSLKDARKEKSLVTGARKVLDSVASSKLVVMSQSVDAGMRGQIESGAKEAGVPTVEFGGTSVALGRLCGLQFRTTAVSLGSLGASGVKSIIKDAESGA